MSSPWEERIIEEAVANARTPVSADDLKHRHPNRFRRGTAAALERLHLQGKLRRSYRKGIPFYEANR